MSGKRDKAPYANKAMLKRNDTSIEIRSQTKGDIVGRAIASTDYSPKGEDGKLQLELRRGDALDIIEDRCANYFFAHLNGKRGLVSKTHVVIINDAKEENEERKGMIPKLKEAFQERSKRLAENNNGNNEGVTLKEVIAIKDYDPRIEGALSFRKGDTIFITHDYGDGQWYFGRKDGETGFVDVQSVREQPSKEQKYESHDSEDWENEIDLIYSNEQSDPIYGNSSSGQDSLSAPPIPPRPGQSKKATEDTTKEKQVPKLPPKPQSSKQSSKTGPRPPSAKPEVKKAEAKSILRLSNSIDERPKGNVNACDTRRERSDTRPLYSEIKAPDTGERLLPIKYHFTTMGTLKSISDYNDAVCLIEVKTGEESKTGTGLRVGRKYIMTACDNIYDSVTVRQGIQSGNDYFISIKFPGRNSIFTVKEPATYKSKELNIVIAEIKKTVKTALADIPKALSLTSENIDFRVFKPTVHVVGYRKGDHLADHFCEPVHDEHPWLSQATLYVEQNSVKFKELQTKMKSDGCHHLFHGELNPESIGAPVMIMQKESLKVCAMIVDTIPNEEMESLVIDFPQQFSFLKGLKMSTLYDHLANSNPKLQKDLFGE